MTDSPRPPAWWVCVCACVGRTGLINEVTIGCVRGDGGGVWGHLAHSRGFWGGRRHWCRRGVNMDEIDGVPAGIILLRWSMVKHRHLIRRSARSASIFGSTLKSGKEKETLEPWKMKTEQTKQIWKFLIFVTLTNKSLYVDGFTSETSSWTGPGLLNVLLHTFMLAPPSVDRLLKIFGCSFVAPQHSLARIIESPSKLCKNKIFINRNKTFLECSKDTVFHSK